MVPCLFNELRVPWAGKDELRFVQLGFNVLTYLLHTFGIHERAGLPQPHLGEGLLVHVEGISKNPDFLLKFFLIQFVVSHGIRSFKK